MRGGDLLTRAAVAVGSTIARAAGAFIADLSLSLGKGMAIAIARRALAIKATDTRVGDNFVHFGWG